MATIKVKLNVCRASKSGTYPIVLQLIHRRERRMIGVGIRIAPDDFDACRGRVCYHAGSSFRRSEIAEMNRRIESVRTTIAERIAQNENDDYTVEEIAVWFKHQTYRKYLFPYVEQQIREKNEARKWGIARAYQATASSLSGFCPSKSILLSDINARFVHNYELYLQRQNLSRNTIAYYMRNLRTLYNRAKADGLVDGADKGSPFFNVHMSPAKTIKRALSAEQLRAIASLDLAACPQLAFARDMFMASFYLRGIPFVDLAYLLCKNYVNESIFYYRRKTGVLVEVEVIPALRYLIKRYKSDSPYLFPLLSVADKPDAESAYIAYREALFDYNRRLKRIGELAGLNIPLTGYVARHSWATMAKRKGGSTTLISEGLGHSSERITQVYLKSLDGGEIDRLNLLVAEL